MPCVARKQDFVKKKKKKESDMKFTPIFGVDWLWWPGRWGPEVVFEAAAGRLMGRGDRGIGMGRAEEGAGWDPVIINCL